MRDSNTVTLEKVVSALIKYLPDTEFETFSEFFSVFERLKGKNEKQKQNYQKKAEYHREVTRLWRKNNKERNRAYQREWCRNNKDKIRAYREKHKNTKHLKSTFILKKKTKKEIE